MLQVPRLNPARSYDEALERVRALQRDDGPEILPAARTALLDCGSAAPLAVLLLHGFTNHPGQYRDFAPLLRERGANVLIPRLPEHGDRDRLTNRLGNLTGQRLLDAAWSALDITCGLGERVVVAGISSSGLLAAYFAQYRRDVSRAIAISPEFALLDLSYGATRALAWAARILPDRFLWWDPRVKNGMHPLTAYPRFSTRALAQTLLIADDVWAAAKRAPCEAQSIVAIVNARDPAVNNHATRKTVSRWNRLRAGVAAYRELQTLPRNHDIIEPDNPNARTAQVYPELLRAIVDDKMENQ